MLRSGLACYRSGGGASISVEGATNRPALRQFQGIYCLRHAHSSLPPTSATSSSTSIKEPPPKLATSSSTSTKDTSRTICNENGARFHPVLGLLYISVRMALGQGAKRSILGLPFRAQQQTAQAYSSAFQTHQLSTHVPQDGMFLRRFSSEMSSSEQMDLIKQLRQRTSAPIKDVKASLVTCNWDIEAAQKDLRKRGVALAAKKSSCTAAEGLLAIAQDDKRAAVVELNCETDFVARNDVFQYLASSLAKMALSAQGPGELCTPFGPEFLEDMSINLDHPKLSGETTVQSAITEVAAMVGENVKLRRGLMLSTTAHGVVSSYMHTCPQPGMGRIAGLVTLEAEDSSALIDAVKSVGSSIAMHIVAAKPLFLSKELVSASALESEREILRTQAESSGKSQMAMDKMVEGRLRKYFEEVVLMEQKYVLNDSTNIKTVLNDLSKEVGSKVTIGNFVRMEVGEGIDRAEAADGSEVAGRAM